MNFQHREAARAPRNASAQIFVQIDRAVRGKDMLRAVRLAQEALDAGHAHPVLFNLRAQWKKHKGRFAEALADFGRAEALEPASAAILCEVADCRNSLGEHGRALAAADRALALDGTLAAAWYHKGLAHQMRTELAPARAAYREAVRRQPRLAAAQAQLANLAAAQGDYDDAVRHADAALALEPGNQIAALARVAADLAQGRLAQAEPRLRALLSDKQAPEPVLSIAKSLAGDLFDAQDRIQEAFDAYCGARAGWRTLYEAQ